MAAGNIVALSPAEITLAVIGMFALILVVVIVRVVARDRRIRRVRVGVFYERDRKEDDDERTD